MQDPLPHRPEQPVLEAEPVRVVARDVGAVDGHDERQSVPCFHRPRQQAGRQDEMGVVDVVVLAGGEPGDRGQRREHERRHLVSLAELAPLAQARHPVDVDPVDDLARRQTVKGHGHDIDLMALGDELAPELIGYRRATTADGRKLVVQRQDPHGDLSGIKSVGRPFAARLPRRIPPSGRAIAKPRYRFVMPSDTDASALGSGRSSEGSRRHPDTLHRLVISHDRLVRVF